VHIAERFKIWRVEIQFAISMKKLSLSNLSNEVKDSHLIRDEHPRHANPARQIGILGLKRWL